MIFMNGLISMKIYYRLKEISRFVLLLATFVPVAALAQKQEYRLKGFVGVQGGESFTYELNLAESGNGSIIGTASTYLDPDKDVVATLTASIDRGQKKLTLREKDIIANNGFKSSALICLIEAVLTYDEAEKKLYGPLITKTAGNGAECSKGSITFMNKEELDLLFGVPVVTAGTKETAKSVAPAAPSQPKIDPSKPMKVIYDTLPDPAPIALKKRSDNVTEGKDKTYIWHTDTVIADIWDGNNIDGDRVTILYNGTEVLKDYVLTADKKRLLLPIGGNELNILTIEARNEGGDPPNTANLVLTDGAIVYDVVAHNATGKRAVILISRQ